MTTTSLTVRAAAELLPLPAYSQARILTEQKHPRVGSQAFKLPYYRTAVSGMVAYFREGGSILELDKSRAKVQRFNQKAKRANNMRVLASFQKSAFSARRFQVTTLHRLSATFDGVELRLSPDLRVRENGESKIIYLNCKTDAIDPELARRTLEIGHWVFEANGNDLPMKKFEYVDLAADRTYSFKTRRVKTISAAAESTKIIGALWPTL